MGKPNDNEFLITDEQVEQLKPFMPNIEEIIKLGLGEFLTELNYLIIDALDKDYNSTPASDKLEKLYDDIYYQN